MAPEFGTAVRQQDFDAEDPSPTAKTSGSASRTLVRSPVGAAGRDLPPVGGGAHDRHGGHRRDHRAGGVPARLPRHLRDARHRRRRPGDRGPGRPRPPLHARRPVREGQQLRGQGLRRRPPAVPDAPDRAQGQRPVRADQLGRRARRDHRAVPGRSRRARPGGDHAGQLPRHRGHPQRAQRRGPVLQPDGRHDQRADLLRLGGLHRLHDDDRCDRRGGPGEPGALALHPHLGLQHDLDQSAPVAVRRRGAAPGREGRRHRPGPPPHRPAGRLVPADPPGHRRRSRPGDDARDHRRGADRRGLRPRPHGRLRRADRAGAAVHPRVGRGADRHPGRRHPHPRPRVRHQPAVDDPDRRGHRAAGRRRADGALHRLPAGAGGGLAAGRRRTAAAAAVGLPGQLGRPDAP